MSIIESAKEFVKELMKTNDPSHDWYHVERVWKNAVYIAQQERILNKDLVFDMEIVELAALFHDAVDFKYDNDQNRDLKDIACERLNSFFEKHSYPKEKIEKILYIILNISWRKELEQKEKKITDIPVELKIVRDSDRLDAIGAIGVARCFAFSGAKYRPFYIEDVEPIKDMTAEQYNKQTLLNKSTAINHFYEKLLLIKEKIQTSTGLKMAEQRHEFMELFLKQFELETNPSINNLN